MATGARDMINQFVRGAEGLETHIIILRDQLQVILPSSRFRMTVRITDDPTHLTPMFAQNSEKFARANNYWRSVLAAWVAAVRMMMMMTASGDGDEVTESPRHLRSWPGSAISSERGPGLDPAHRAHGTQSSRRCQRVCQ